MKQTTAVNLALFLVVVGWLMAYYGVMSQLGDPSPTAVHATSKLLESCHVRYCLLAW